MSLLCRLGRHRPRGIPRWNDGYYFAACERCGCDLVRTAFQRWHVPSGYRVVWSDRPPAARPEVTLVPSDNSAPATSGMSRAGAEPAHGADSAPIPVASVREPDGDHSTGPVPPSPPPNGPSGEAPAPAAEAGASDALLGPQAPAALAGASDGRLPIQDVLAQLNAEEEAANRTEETEPSPEESPAQRRRSTWDFMDDDPFAKDSGSRLAQVGGTPASAHTHGLSPGVASSGHEAASSANRLGERWRAVRSAVSNFWSGPAEPNAVLVIALALTVAVGVAVALALALPSADSSSDAGLASSRPGRGSEGVGRGEVPDPFAASSPDTSGAEADSAIPEESDYGAGAPEERGYVIASLLSCRAAPALQAQRVRNLARGQEVRVLGYDRDWASLLYRDGQCWAQARFISPVPPL